MRSGTLVPVEEYLSTSYSPDCEYLEGMVTERNVGEWEHSRLQMRLGAYLFNREEKLRIRVVTEQRVQVKKDRFRVPDVCVILAGSPIERIVTHPPLICAEVLSPDDRMSDVLAKIDDYLAFGVGYVWVIDPLTRHAQIYDSAGVHEMKDGKLWTSDPEILVPFDQLFE